MKIASRFRAVIVAAAMATAAFASGPAFAQSDAYPTRTIRMVVGYGAGGGTDIIGRLVAQQLQIALGHNVVVENRPGGSGFLGPDVVAKATPDGYTVLFAASGQMSIGPAVYAKVPFVTLKDFIPVSLMSNYPLIMVVNKDHPAKTLREFITWAKANPDKTNYGSTSAAFVMASELFKQQTATPGQMIPYKSSNESVMAVVGNQSTYAIAEPPPVVPQVQSGTVRALAVTGATRLPELPDVPTMAEGGVTGADVTLWLGLFVPAGTPPAIVSKLEAACQAMAKLPEFKAKLRALSADAIGSTSAEFATVIANEIKMWAEVKKAANLTFEQ